MQLSEADLGDFIQIYKGEYGEDLAEDAAREMASNLLNLYEALLQPLPQEVAEWAKESPCDQLGTSHHNPSNG